MQRRDLDRPRRRRALVWMLLFAWVTYSGALLGWWAYTEPGVDVCLAAER